MSGGTAAAGTAAAVGASSAAAAGTAAAASAGFTLGDAALAASLIGSAVSGVGAIQSAQAQKQSADYQAKVAADNAATATQNANYTMASGEQAAAIAEQKTRAQMGAIESAQGSSGVDINSPTAQAVRTSTSEIGALDAQTIRSNAARAAYGYQTQSTNFTNQQNLDVQTGNNASTSGYINAGAGILSAAGSAAKNYSGAVNDASGLTATDSQMNLSNSSPAQSSSALDQQLFMAGK